MMRTMTMLILTLLVSSASAGERERRPVPGEQTRAWLELQKSNNASWGEPRELPADVAQRVYERYLRSFEQPIPEQFDRDADSAESR